MDAGRLSLDQITVNALSLPETVEACARHGVLALAVWRDSIAEV